jgi:hypothetical protein
LTCFRNCKSHQVSPGDLELGNKDYADFFYKDTRPDCATGKVAKKGEVDINHGLLCLLHDAKCE